MEELPEGYREPPPPGTLCEHKLCPGHPAVVTFVLRWPHAPSDRTKHLCAEHHVLTLERIAKWEAEQEDLRAMAREFLKKPEQQQRLMDDTDREMKTPECWRNERADTEMEIEVMKSFLDGRGPFPVAEFLPGTEEMSQAEIRDLAADYLEALREDLEMIDKILGKSRG
jgi:hypothetical protein